MRWSGSRFIFIRQNHRKFISTVISFFVFALSFVQWRDTSLMAFFFQNQLKNLITLNCVNPSNSLPLFAEAAANGKKDLYKVLGVSKKATPAQIKATFRKLSLKYHPDKNPSSEASQLYTEISEAYNVLNDANKRSVYDREGFRGLERYEQTGEESSMDPMNIFQSMFGGQVFREEDDKAPPTNLKIYVSLEDLYFGTELLISYTRPAVCDNLDKCLIDNADCVGKGVKVLLQRFGPGVVVKNQVFDESCISRGRAWRSSCKACPRGIRVPKTVELTAIIEPGLHSGQALIFEEQGEEYVGKVKGDLVLTIEELPHPEFVRKGDDLETVMHIDLKDALVGFSRELKHLDNTKVLVNQSTVTYDGAILRHANRGMPKSTGYGENGNLLISMKIRYPTSLSSEQKKLIETALSNVQYHTIS